MVSGELGSLPSGVRGLLWLGERGGATASFRAQPGRRGYIAYGSGLAGGISGGREMLTERLLALAALAGQVVVDAAAAGENEWETAQRGYARLLGRGNARRIRLAEQRLAETREQVIGTARPDAEVIRAALAVRWTGRLADLLEENPAAEADLQALAEQLREVLPARTPAGNQAVSANGEVTADAAGTPGPEHPGALAARLPVAERVLGPDHPDTLASRASLSYWTGRAGDAAAARDQFAALLPVAERVVGPDHPDTLASRHNLANFAGYAGDAAAARDQFAALLPARERAFGADSPATLTARFNLAYWTGRAGDAAAARDQFAALLPARERVSGPDHPDTLAAREELAYWTGCAGDAAAARDQFAALLPVRERILGPEHAETLAVWHQLAHWTALASDADGARD